MKKGFWIIAAFCLVVAATAFFIVRFNSVSTAKVADVEFAPMQKNMNFQQKVGSVKNNTNGSAGPLSNVLPSGIFVRSADGENDSLLVKFADTQEIYKYDGATNTISGVYEAEWLGGKNEISCREQEYKVWEFVDIDEQTATLFVWKTHQKLPTLGHYALHVLESPQKNWRPSCRRTAHGPKAPPAFGVSAGGAGKPTVSDTCKY